MVETIKTQLHKALVRLLREQREMAGLSQQELAARCNRTQQWVAIIESGQRRIDVVEYRAIARAIGFSWLVALSAIEHERGLELDGKPAPNRPSNKRTRRKR